MRDIDPVLLFGEKIRVLRKEKRLSQEKFAQLLELDRTYIGGIERGERNISLRVLFQIAEALEMPPKELLDF